MKLGPTVFDVKPVLLGVSLPSLSLSLFLLSSPLFTSLSLLCISREESIDGSVIQAEAASESWHEHEHKRQGFDCGTVAQLEDVPALSPSLSTSPSFSLSLSLSLSLFLSVSGKEIRFFIHLILL